MADYTRRTVTTTVVEYAVRTEPYGACWTEVTKALNAAVREVMRDQDREPADDAIRFHCADDEVIIRFEQPDDPNS